MASQTEAEKYQTYLCSREWSELKNKVHERSGGVCERCEVNPGENVHHLTYERKYHERPEDLAHWCQGCHKFTHGKSDVDPAEDHSDIHELTRLVLVCPYCGCDNVQINEVSCRRGTDATTVITLYCTPSDHWWDIAITSSNDGVTSFQRKKHPETHLDGLFPDKSG